MIRPAFSIDSPLRIQPSTYSTTESVFIYLRKEWDYIYYDILKTTIFSATSLFCYILLLVLCDRNAHFQLLDLEIIPCTHFPNHLLYPALHTCCLQHPKITFAFVFRWPNSSQRLVSRRHLAHSL